MSISPSIEIETFCIHPRIDNTVVLWNLEWSQEIPTSVWETECGGAASTMANKVRCMETRTAIHQNSPFSMQFKIFFIAENAYNVNILSLILFKKLRTAGNLLAHSRLFSEFSHISLIPSILAGPPGLPSSGVWNSKCLKPQPGISLMTCPISYHGCSWCCWGCWCAGWVGVTFSYIKEQSLPAY